MQTAETAWLSLALLAIVLTQTGRAMQQSAEVEDYATAGSEDIYFQPDDDYRDVEEFEYEVYPGENEEFEPDPDPEQELSERGDNIEAIGVDEQSCEYSCPRYYRPVCAKRDDQLITYATPCEYFNQLRCANVARQQGKDAPTYQLLYHDVCK